MDPTPGLNEVLALLEADAKGAERPGPEWVTSEEVAAARQKPEATIRRWLKEKVRQGLMETRICGRSRYYHILPPKGFEKYELAADKATAG